MTSRNNPTLCKPPAICHLPVTYPSPQPSTAQPYQSTLRTHVPQILLWELQLKFPNQHFPSTPTP